MANAKPPPGGLLHDAATVIRGILMGSADVIPGVSGGTVALIVGIYERLVTAISHFDVHFLSLVRRGQWLRAAVHIDLRFLVALAAGIGIGIVALGGLMNELLAGPVSRPLTLAAFFGMILASTLIVGRKIEVKWASEWVTVLVCGVVGAAFAWWLTTLAETSVQPSLSYLFFCGMIAICAMILPGISGAYILMILGAYAYMTSILKALPQGQVSLENVVAVAVFATGCGIGLLSFSKILRWLLAQLHSQTMAVLCGFMIGAIRKIWPFQRDETPEVAELDHKRFVNEFPDVIDGQFLLVVAIAIAAMLAVLALDRWGRSTTSASRGETGPLDHE
jgi:putative membrane protein